jgi:hypothetical protein
MGLVAKKVCVALGLALFVGAGAGAGCGRVLAEDTPASPPDSGERDDASPADAGAADASATDVSACQLAPAPSCGLEVCTKRILHAPKSPGAPWGIATDESSVYWLEQPATADGYNGKASARVLRASKGPNNDASQATELATEQQQAITLAVTGGAVYWTVYDGASPDPFSTLRRVRTDCPGNCLPESLLVTMEGVRIMKLVPAGAGVLFGIGETGQVFRFDVGGTQMSMAGPLLVKSWLTSLARTDQHVFVSSHDSATISRMDVDGSNLVESFLTVPSRDGGEPGLTNMWSDCTQNVWARRGPGMELVHLSLADAGMRTLVESAALTLFDVAGDARYLYLAGANEGLFALDRETDALTKVGGAKTFAVAADDDGVYWGEHHIGIASAGTIHMLVK